MEDPVISTELNGSTPDKISKKKHKHTNGVEKNGEDEIHDKSELSPETVEKKKKKKSKDIYPAPESNGHVKDVDETTESPADLEKSPRPVSDRKKKKKKDKDEEDVNNSGKDLNGIHNNDNNNNNNNNEHNNHDDPVVVTAVESSRADVGTSPRPEKKQIKKIQVDENLAIHELNSSTEIHDEDSDGKKREKRVNKKKKYKSDDDDHRRPRSRSQRALDFKKNEIGEVIYKGHPSWALMQNIQIGLRHSVGKSSQLYREQDIERIAQIKEFEKYEQLYKSPNILEFPPEGGPETQPHKSPSFKFKDYCPLVFRHLREKFLIDPADYMVSLCNTLENGQNALRLLPTPGKSGSLFFFSHDFKYILKTIPKREAKLLRFLLPAYYKHVMENTNTLLPRFFGLHRVKPKGGRQVRFVVMGNVFETQKKIHERFDLKGSKFGRAVSEEERATFKENTTYKDVDWIERGKKLYIGADRKKVFIEQLKKDCQLLEKLNIMDYSLLVGIHDCSRNECNCQREEDENQNSIRRKKKKDSLKRKEKEEKERKEKEKTLANSNSNISTNSNKEEQSVTDKTERTERTEPLKDAPDENKTKKRGSLEDGATPSKDVKPTTEAPPTETKPTTDRRNSITSALSSFMPGHRKNQSSMNSIDDFNRKQSMVQTSIPLPDHFQSKGVSIFQSDEGGMKGIKNNVSTEEYYFVGIIDILMLYSLRKRGEHAYKSLRFGKEISAVHPVEYSKRFQHFMESVVE